MSTQKTRLLIVEDHIDLAKNLADFFSGDQYTLDFASDGLTALHLVATNQYDVIALDIMLPGVNGFEICRRIRTDLGCHTPIIMMTAKDQITDKEQGFDLGADDYLIKPFNLRELQLRISALEKRSKSNHGGLLKADSIQYNLGTFTVTIDAKDPIELSGTSAKIFELIMQKYPNFVSYNELSSKIWGDREVDLNVIRTHTYSLRKTLQKNFNENLIKTIHGQGYRLTPPERD